MNLNIFKQRKKIAVITGATGGLGKSLVQHLLQHGYNIIMVARSLVQLEQISLQFGKKVTAFVCDISHANDVHYLCHNIKNTFGKIDVLIHSAGNIHPGPFEYQNDQTIQNQIQVNLTGAIFVTKGLLPLINKKGSIIFINSLGGLLPLKNSALYSASKFGLRGFALALAQELRSKKIYVSSILPSAIDTTMLHQEIKEGGSSLNFCSPPLTTDAVCKTVIKAIQQKKLEYYLPKYSALQIKIVMLNPSLLKWLIPFFEKIGEKEKQKWLAQKQK